MTGWRVYNGSGFIVDNLTTNDSAKALSAAQGKALQDNKLEANKVGAANGVASLDANTKVPISQLRNASTTAIGAVQLNNTLTSVSTAQAATAAQAKALNDKMLGVGQIWQNVLSVRSINTDYINNTGRPIQVSIWQGADTNPSLIVDGVTVASIDGTPGSVGVQATAIVPSGSTYRVTASVDGWAELR